MGTPEERVTRLIELMQQHTDLMTSMINHQAAQTAAQNAATAAATAPAQAPAQGMGPQQDGGGKLVAKYFQCTQVTGKPEHWSDFAFRFKRAAKSQNNEVYKMLTSAEVAEDTYDLENKDDHDNPELSGTMYDILCQHVDGEGFSVLKAMSSACRGFEAWNRLVCKYNPTTKFSRGLQLLTKVVNPGRLNNYSDVESGIVLWEEKVGQLQSQFDEKLSDKLKSAVIINAMPSGIQDQVFQQMKVDSKYDDIKILIKRFAARKMESNGPTPMDVGNLQAPSWGSEEQGANWQEDQWGEEQWGVWQEDVSWQEDHSIPHHDINGIQDAICYSCNQKGHIAPNCPNKGKGKGKNGKGKGKGGKGYSGKGYGPYQPIGGWQTKGGWKGGYKGDKGKGKGKGYQGACWGRGQIGHKQGQCQHQQQAQQVQQGQQAQPGPAAVPEQPNNVVSPAAGFTPIGSVWMVGNVEARYRNQTEVQNRFSAFEDESEDAKEVEEKTSEPYISPKAKKEAFWIRSQAKEKEAKKKAKEENELMESLIGIPEAVIGQRYHSRKRRVRFCEEFTTNMPSCADTCCTSENMAVEHDDEELEQAKTEMRTVERRAGDADRGAASEAIEVNVVQTLEAGVSRSVRWEKEAPKEVNGIGDEQWTGPIAIRFNISNVQRPLAAASKVAGQGNRIIMEGSGGYIENIATGERIQLRLERGVYVFDVVLPDGKKAVVALDSGAGVCVWPETWKVAAKLEEKVEGLSMIAANGTEILNLGQNVIQFKAVRPFTGQLGR